MKAQIRELGRRVAERRRIVGLTQEQLAERAGVNVKSLQGVEQGRTEPELRTMRKIARALGTSMDALLAPRGAAPSREALVKEIQKQLQVAPISVLEPIAAILRAFDGEKSQGKRRVSAKPIPH